MAYKLSKKLSDNKGQRSTYRRLVDAAYAAEARRLKGNIPPKEDWRRKINMETTGKYSTTQMNQGSDFDTVILELAIMAGDDHWIGRCATNDVRVLRWVIEKQFIPDLEFLKQRKLDWNYIKGICNQANFPQTLLDCPAQMLVCVLQMADTHIRLLAKRNGVEIIDLPSGHWRKGVRPADKALAMFRHDHHHIKHGEAA